MKLKKKTPGLDINLEKKRLEIEKAKADIELIKQQVAYTESQTKHISKPWWKREPIAALTLVLTLITSFFTNIGAKINRQDVNTKNVPEVSEPADQEQKNKGSQIPKKPAQTDNEHRSKKSQESNTPNAVVAVYYDPLADLIEQTIDRAATRIKLGEDPAKVKAEVISYLQKLKEQDIYNTGTELSESDAIDKMIRKLERI